ncbi:MAG: regulatory protein RecX [Elusimicrobia bacterium]|nr:regulatory protein RecX [Elusimicrobiota bacterium]
MNPIIDEGLLWNKTLKIFSRRAQSVTLLRRKLELAGAVPAQIDHVVARAKKSGFLNDLEYAKMLVRREARKGRGLRRVEEALRNHGIDPEVAQSALTSEEALATSEQELSAAQKALQKRYKLSSPKMAAKAYGFLLRQGFSPEISRKAVRYDDNGGGDE